MKPKRCDTCRYWRVREGTQSHHADDVEGDCRRRAPQPFNYLLFHELELLREMAWTLRALADLEEPPRYDVLHTEAMSAMEAASWPRVNGDGWCGEWERQE